MDCIFLNSADQVIFSRADMEQGHWIQQEMTVSATFPLVQSKLIERGQRIAFRDPATDILEIFEIRNVENTPAGKGQQIKAEHIAIAELSDEHINNKEITGKTAAEAVTSVLTGTLWSLGTNTASGTQDADIARGDVWQAIKTIERNWNVYITPRLVISSAGLITGRYLDVAPANGTFRGLRLSVRKNITDPNVRINDEDVLTALYGYGGLVDVPQSGGAEDQSQELTFADVAWSATSDHPAKPLNQTYLEDPAKTALYGRNGRPRYGYYQNSSIKDQNILLEKTWEALKLTSEPKISITGTCVDLYRLGYKDQPIRLHDMVIVEIEDTEESYYKQIIINDVDLIDPTNTAPEIGDYIPNIIYINRDTDKKSSGGGGGGGRGQTNQEHKDGETWADLIKTQNMVGMVVGIYDGGMKIKGGEITIAINDDHGTTALIQADTIDMQGVVTAMEAYSLQVVDFNGHDGEFTGELKVTGGPIIGYDYVQGTTGKFNSLDINGDAATWRSYQARFCSLGNAHYYLYAASQGSTTPTGTNSGQLVSSHTDTTIHYLGGAST